MKTSPSLRSLAKQLGISHSTLSKISNGKYPASTSNILKKIIDHVNGVMIPADKYEDVMKMLKDASFPKFGDTSITAAWLYELVKSAQEKVSKN